MAGLRPGACESARHRHQRQDQRPNFPMIPVFAIPSGRVCGVPETLNRHFLVPYTRVPPTHLSWPVISLRQS